jgi:hypothetical protein
LIRDMPVVQVVSGESGTIQDFGMDGNPVEEPGR